MFQQKGDVGRQRRSEREEQSEDHEKRPAKKPSWLLTRRAWAKAWAILPRSN
jgi:hypothetical protein